MLLLYGAIGQPEGVLWASGNLWSSPARKMREKMLADKVKQILST
jgi:hypothetical protein